MEPRKGLFHDRLKYLMQEDRWSISRRNLESILARKGTVYTLGLLMGILCRLSQSDYTLFKEIEIRAQQAKDDS